MLNVGSIDRALRFGAGSVLLTFPFIPFFDSFFAGFGRWKFGVAAIGGILIVTALFRFCAAYALLGIRTCPINKT